MPLFNRIAVEFVPEGMTAEEARSSRNRDNKLSSGRDMVIGLGSLVLLVGMVVAPYLWWSNGRTASADAPPPPPEVAQVALPSPIPITPTPTASPTPAPTETPTATPMVEKSAKSLLQQPLSPIEPTVTPRPPHPEERTPTPTNTATPTNTPLPPYEVIYNAVHPEGNTGASYHVSGWIVEADGVTPRPVAMELCYSDGCLYWPRPGAADTATGYYEFLVSPGFWWLRVMDTDGVSVPVEVAPDGPARYEVSIRYNGDRNISVARSDPWDARYPTPVGIVEAVTTSPVATPTTAPKLYQVYLPIVEK